MTLAEARQPKASDQGPPIVGRQDELRRLDDHLDLLGEGGGGFLEIVGEPGIGKSTLLAALARRGTERRFLVLRGRASQFELETPFDPFVDALDDYLATVHPRRLEPLGEERVGELASIFPSVTEAAGAARPPLPTEERYRLHRSVRELLACLAREKPLFLILDDAHWSDQASLELLHHLVRRPPNAPVMLAIAYRTGTMPEGWTTLADSAEREGDLSRIEVGPLGERDSDALLSGQVGDADIRGRIFDAAGGNPFFIRQLAEAPQVVRASDAAAREHEGVPKAVLAAIGEEVAGLGEPTREALQAAAVAGDPFEPDSAAVAAGISEDELLPRLDELRSHGLVRPGDSPRRFQFRHPLVWRGVSEGTPAGWRLAAHRRLAADLAARGASAATRAPHVEASATPGDLDAARVLREAAEATVARAPASAVHWFQAALRLLPETPETMEDRISLLVASATTLGSIGRLEESRDRLREAVVLIPEENEPMRVEAIVALATMENLMRNLPEATRLLTDALAALSDPESAQAAEILLALATLHIFDHDMRSARDWGREALELGVRRGMRPLEAAAAGVLAHNEGRLGRVAEANELLDQAAPVVDSLATDTISDLPGLFWISIAEMQVERWEDSLRHGDRARALARGADQGRWLPQIAASQAHSLWLLGRLPEALAAFDEAIEMAQLTGNKQFDTIASCGRMKCATDMGELADALATAKRCIEVAGPLGEGDFLSALSRQSASVPTLASGDAAGARDSLLQLLDESGYPRTGSPLWQPIGLRALTEAELELGNVDAAEASARRAQELCDSFGLGMRRSWGLQPVAAVELARGDANAAIETAREAVSSAASAGAQVEEGRSRTLLGRALAADGETETAETELRRAYEQLDACGAGYRRDAAAHELRALGVRVATPARRGPSENGAPTLSDREREIAELVAEGRSNKEIGAALYISPKTVEKHLGSAFRKLGVSKRAQVAAAIERERAEAAMSSGPA